MCLCLSSCDWIYDKTGKCKINYSIVYPDTTITYDSVFGDYMHYILGRNYDFDYSEEDIAEVMKTEEYKAMATYPEEGYIGVINDVLVIKFDAE